MTLYCHCDVIQVIVMVILSSSCYTSHCDGYTGHRRDSYTGHWDVILVICYVICNHYRSVLLVVQSE